MSKNDRRGSAGTKVPASVLGRAGRLLLAGAKIASDEVAGRVAAKLKDIPEAQVLAQKLRQTRELVSTLGQLKGAAMKAGQMLALEFGDLMPPEVVEILRELHDSGSFMPFHQVRYILGRELGRDKLAALEDLTPEPIAAASIGQVHRATLNGEQVVVKVQFPGVAKTIDSDLAVLRRIAGIYLSTQGKSIDLDQTFEELAKGFKEEADYRLEAASLVRYQALLNHQSFVVPRVYPEYSTERVLTMSYERGERLGAWLKSKPDEQAVAQFAPLVVELLVREFFVNGLVQTDPNYGNFLYRPAENQLVLLDFGATREYPVSFRNDVRDLLVATVDGDDAGILALTFDHNLLDRRESAATQALYVDLMHHMTLMFVAENQPFRFDDDRYIKELRDKVLRFTKSVEHSPPARQLIFLNRKLGGMFHLLKDLGGSLDLKKSFDEVRTLNF